MDHSVEQTKSVVDASSEELNKAATDLRNAITAAKENIRNEAFAKSNAQFLQTFDADFGKYLDAIDQTVTDTLETAAKMKAVAQEQQATSEKSIEI